MSGLYSVVSYAVLTAALISLPLFARERSPRNGMIALVAGFAVALTLRPILPGQLIVSLFGFLPVPVVVYGLARISTGWGVKYVPCARWELATALLLLVLVLLSTAGVIPVDLYDFGYESAFVLVIATMLALYAWWRRHILLGLSVLLAQILWLADIGSSNFIDHLLHVILVFPLLWLLVRPRGKTELGN